MLTYLATFTPQHRQAWLLQIHELRNHGQELVGDEQSVSRRYAADPSKGLSSQRVRPNDLCRWLHSLRKSQSTKHQLSVAEARLGSGYIRVRADSQALGCRAGDDRHGPTARCGELLSDGASGAFLTCGLWSCCRCCWPPSRSFVGQRSCPQQGFKSVATNTGVASFLAPVSTHPATSSAPGVLVMTAGSLVASNTHFQRRVCFFLSWAELSCAALCLYLEAVISVHMSSAVQKAANGFNGAAVAVPCNFPVTSCCCEGAALLLTCIG